MNKYEYWPNPYIFSILWTSNRIKLCSASIMFHSSFIAASDTSYWKVKSEALYLDYVALWWFSLLDVPAKVGRYTYTQRDSQKGPFCHLKAKEQGRPPTATAETVRLLWALTAYSGLECIEFSFLGWGGSVESGIIWPPKPWGKTVSCKSGSPWGFLMVHCDTNETQVNFQFRLK